MGKTIRIPNRPSRRGEPTWEAIEDVLPEQGEWTEQQYLKLSTDRRVEFTNGKLEYLPMPTRFHQSLMILFCVMLRELVVEGQKGIVSASGLKLELGNGKWRSPDVLYLRPSQRYRDRNDAWDYADLVIEIVSPDGPKRDLVRKRREYAQAGIPEYWIVDPRDNERRITVLSLPAGAKEYVEAGTYPEGTRAPSVIVPEFLVDVSGLFAEAMR